MTGHAVVDVQGFKEAVGAVERENFRPGNALDALDRATMSEGYLLWVNEDRTVLVRWWPDNTVEVCTRSESDAIWGPPQKLEMEAQR
jgi:hypothetical protein